MLPSDAAEHREPAWVYAVVGLAVAVVIGAEFAYDLSERPALHDAVVAVDVALTLGFAAYVARHAWRARARMFEWFIEHRWDVFLVTVSLLLLAIVPRVASAFVVGRLVVKGLARLLETALGRAAVRQVSLKPTQTMTLSFAAIILVGALLLTFPAATIDGNGATFTDAVFTATSATCVTGLAVVDTGSYFTLFGQVVIILLVQVGGLGIQVLSATFAILVGGRLPTRQQSGLGQLLDVNTAEGLKVLVTSIAATTVLFELAGAAMLYLTWATGLQEAQPGYDTPARALWWAVFHSISAFNNAGFSLSSTSMMPWVGNPVVCGVIGTLVVVGGLGFFVVADLARERIREILKPRVMWNRLSLQTRVVLVMTLALNVVGTLVFLFLEYDGALQGLGVLEKLVASTFMAVVMRTAGFNSVPVGDLAAPTIIFVCMWMFMGGGPGSTAGGIKVTTAAVVFTAVRSMLRGRTEVEMFGRTVPQVVVYRSISIVFISGLVIACFLAILTSTQQLPFERLAFETVSAFGTVGMSLDVTPSLDVVGRWWVILLMYIGRVGPLTLALAIGERLQPPGFHYPEGRIAVG